MKIKRILLVLVCLVLILFTSGCASIEYGRIINKEGQIIDAVSVKLDNKKIASAGFNTIKTINDIKNKMNLYLNSVVSNFYGRDDKLSVLEKSSVMNNITYGVSENNGYLIASIKFKNYTAFKYFYGLHLNEETENDNTKIEKDFLVNKAITTGKTIFSGEDAKYISNEIISYFDDKFTLDDAQLSYVFGTYQNKFYSDATNVYYEDGINYHQWIINNINQDITTFTLSPNPVNWYILGLALTGILIVLLFIISFFKKNKNKNTPLSISEVENEAFNENQF